MSLSQLKFITPPYVDVTVLGTTFMVSAVTSIDADVAGRPKSKSYFMGVVKGGSLRSEGPVRFSKEQWDSLDAAHNAWWNGFTIEKEIPIAGKVAAQLIEDGSAVAI